MWATTPQFNEALNLPNRKWRSRIEVFYGDQLQQSLDVLLSGSVKLDNVAVRRQVDMEIADVDGLLTPASAADLLAPKGTELRVSRGLVLADGTTEWIPLGVFGVVEPEVKASPGNGTVLSLKGYDRVDAVRNRRFDSAYTVAKGTPTTTAATQIVTTRMSVNTRVTTTSSTTPETVFEALSDPWDAVRDLADADSLVAYFDPQGTLVIGPDAGVETGITYEPGPESFLIDSSRKMDSSKTYSGVVVNVEHPDQTPIRYVLWDTDPKSPTYADGPFGRRPYGFSSSLITSMAQAQLAAQTLLARVRQIPQTAEIVTAGHIGHDVGDVVSVVDPRTRTVGRWRIVGGQIPLRPGTNSWKLEQFNG